MPEDAFGDFLGALPLLGNLSDDQRERVAAQSRTVGIRAGEWLFRQGDPAGSAYLLRSGRLEVIAEGPPAITIRELKRGAVLGELALLSEMPRSASVRARRDSELIELDRASFEALIRDAPGFALALTRSIGAQLAASQSPAPVATPPRTIAVVPLDPGAPARWIADGLATELGRYGSIGHLSSDPHRPVADFPVQLDRAEGDHALVLLSCPAAVRGDPWTDFCLSEADLVLAVTAGVPDPAWIDHPAALQGCELIVAGPLISGRVLAAFSPRETQVISGEGALRKALRTTARRLTGNSIGLVLSGGGAKAFAHIGVLDELARAGILIDRIGGVSMGSILGGLAATGRNPDEVYANCNAAFVETNPSNDYTLPTFSLIRGRKTHRMLGEVFGATTIEELPLRFFCLSCDLVGRVAVIHRTGSLFEAIYASLSLPGIFPPVSDGPRLLVDGGVLDNLPVEQMARSGEGPVIAVDVSQRGGVNIKQGRPRFERMARPVRRLLTGTEEPLPRLGETLLRTLTLGSTDTTAAAQRHADLVIAPQATDIGMLDWKRLPQAREIGRAAAREALEAAGSLIDGWTER